jgi:hypothetical protein
MGRTDGCHFIGLCLSSLFVGGMYIYSIDTSRYLWLRLSEDGGMLGGAQNGLVTFTKRVCRYLIATHLRKLSSKVLEGSVQGKKGIQSPVVRSDSGLS